jgi:hypothetical protein
MIDFPDAAPVVGLRVARRRRRARHGHAQEPVASLLFLVLTFFSLAAIYVLLGAHFIAAIQIIVYAGAIMVLFLFVIMLLNLGHDYQADLRGGLGSWSASSAPAPSATWSGRRWRRRARSCSGGGAQEIAAAVEQLNAVGAIATRCSATTSCPSSWSASCSWSPSSARCCSRSGGSDMQPWRTWT